MSAAPESQVALAAVHVERPHNRILAALSDDEWRAIRPLLSEHHVEMKTTLLEAHTGNAKLFFNDTALVSVLGETQSGQAVEVALVGPEGAVGITGLLGGRHAVPLKAVVQMPGRVLSMPCHAAREWLDNGYRFRQLILEYVHSLLVQCAQGNVCNRFHTASQRLARWLLMADDRVGPRPLELTQEFLAEMLGVPRTWLTRVAGQFQETGLISYRRGVVTVVNRAGLTRESCECYRLIQFDTGMAAAAAAEQDIAGTSAPCE